MSGGLVGMSAPHPFVELSPNDRQLLKDITVSVNHSESAQAGILRRFERIPQTSESIADITHSTATFRDQAKFILRETKPGREQSLALTALEEAKFWTNQAIALNAEQTA